MKKTQILLDVAKFFRTQSIRYEWLGDVIKSDNIIISNNMIKVGNYYISYVELRPIDNHFYYGYPAYRVSFPCNSLFQFLQKYVKYIKNDNNRKYTAKSKIAKVLIESTNFANSNEFECKKGQIEVQKISQMALFTQL